ncbi:protein jagged-1b isoform X4 [Lingula anatina]|uniref:Protein jagged-1b isoform X4 n=1 Tax=Lingula anatina TaxID=7574 RepID=A0A1S3JYB4_LINAN|nr:protein jagged-1b isoform X4 [Lingula anatina]|eukprot:XP_013415044.1 protein jagged-1b isoform X4 [Lingula anatina]
MMTSYIRTFFIGTLVSVLSPLHTASGDDSQLRLELSDLLARNALAMDRLRAECKGYENFGFPPASSNVVVGRRQTTGVDIQLLVDIGYQKAVNEHLLKLYGNCTRHTTTTKPSATTSVITTTTTSSTTSTTTARPVQSCRDKTDCSRYANDVCIQFPEWSADNCKFFCGFCRGSSTCADKLSNCAAYGDDACTGFYEAWAKENCAKTCNFCGGVPVPPMPTPPLPGGGPSTCADKLSNCAAYGDEACTGVYEDWAKENCAKTCNFCGGSSTCADKLSNCAAYGDEACTGVYEAWAKENCAKTCNFCGGVPVPPMPTPPLPGGVSSCVNKATNCDAYGDSACTQYAAWAKENCAKMCNLCGGSSSGGGYPGYPGNIGTTGSSIVITGQSSGCIYNGKTYKEGEKWNDACKYSCTCSDGVTGFYECNTMCPQWQLPDVCNLQPRPGKCCPKPSCPPNYSITYPAGMSESTLP